MNELNFIDPTYVPAIQRVPMALRPSSLKGKMIGMVDNTKEQADVIFKTIGDALVETIRGLSHSCYLGDRTHEHAWGFGCGTCPACELRAGGWRRWQESRTGNGANG